MKEATNCRDIFDERRGLTQIFRGQPISALPRYRLREETCKRGKASILSSEIPTWPLLKGVLQRFCNLVRISRQKCTDCGVHFAVGSLQICLTQDFMHSNVVTTVDTMTAPLDDIYFPSVVVCNINQV